MTNVVDQVLLSMHSLKFIVVDYDKNKINTFVEIYLFGEEIKLKHLIQKWIRMVSESIAKKIST